MSDSCLYLLAIPLILVLLFVVNTAIDMVFEYLIRRASAAHAKRLLEIENEEREEPTNG